MHEGVVVQPCIMSKAIMLEIKSIYANKQKHPCQITIAPVLKSKALVPTIKRTRAKIKNTRAKIKSTCAKNVYVILRCRGGGASSSMGQGKISSSRMMGFGNAAFDNPPPPPSPVVSNAAATQVGDGSV
jgi:hypothetical protein